MSLKDFSSDEVGTETTKETDSISPEPSDDPNDIGYWIGDC